mmetsp:Transcript_5579/g.9589  ORF Transcript_5579/g.9589 Transcript_5579/m.9589 type:complete len:81 (+) Transcript_5579:932-1174(+)
MLRRLQHFPFGDILFREATECAICLETFNEKIEVVQLKCSKFHIFHFHCIENMLMQENVFNHRCPLCRQLVEVQDPPILN